MGKSSRGGKALTQASPAEASVAAAYAGLDSSLASLASCATYKRLDVCLRFCSGGELSPSRLAWVMELLASNMGPVFGDRWPAEERSRRRDAVDKDARYAFAHACAAGDADAPPLGFVHYRFVVEEEVAVLYVYELQVSAATRGQGLGRFLMLFMELLAKQSPGGLGGVVLTIQRANTRAVGFYTTKCRYSLSAISPAQTDPFADAGEYDYEIYSKLFRAEATATHERVGREARLMNAVNA